MALRQYRAIGRVQGVGFRASVRDQALRLGLGGWAKNCADGSVEILLQGESQALDDMAQWLVRGPRMARVETLHVEPVLTTARLPDRFEIL